MTNTATSHKHLAILAVTLILVGCSNEPDWYDRAKQEDEDKQAFKEQLQSQGLSEREAADAWQERRSRQQTEGYRPYD